MGQNITIDILDNLRGAVSFCTLLSIAAIFIFLLCLGLYEEWSRNFTRWAIVIASFLMLSIIGLNILPSEYQTACEKDRINGIKKTKKQLLINKMQYTMDKEEIIEMIKSDTNIIVK